MNFARVFLMLVAFGLMNAHSTSQTLLFSDTFGGYSTGPLATQGGWSNHFGTGTDVTTSVNQTYPDYFTGNSSNAITISNSVTGADEASFTSQTSTVYYSFILRVSSAPAAEDGFNYIVALAQNNPSVLYFAAVYIKDLDGSNYDIGVAKKDDGDVFYFGGSFAYGSTDHLVVVKYEFGGGVTDDYIYLYVDPTLANAEPTSSPGRVGGQDVTSADAEELSSIVINQTSSDGVAATIDAIRVATGWSEAPLPVQLTNFAAVAGRSGVDLTWSTATEVNNYGFEIERRAVQGNDEWTVVGFVRGAGTSTAPQEYSYSDFGLDAGRYAYRIKQIDFGGAYTYYSAAEVEVGAMPNELALEPNYPNPFNPSTNISFTVPQDGPAVLKVFNMLGQEVATLFNEEAVAGRLYKATFDASSLPTGVYVSRLEFGGQAVMRKMLFVK